MMGIELMVNFKAPYLFSRSIGEYWRRNHISLSEWFRDYVYISLGGNRKGPWKKALFITITYFLSGLWHGAGWTFVVWGLLQAVYLNIESLLGIGKHPRPSNRFVAVCLDTAARLVTFALCCFSLIFFRAQTMGEAWYVIRHCLDGIASPLTYLKTAYMALNTGEILAVLTAFCVSVLFAFDIVNERRDTIQMISAWPLLLRWPVYIGFVLMLLILMQKGGSVPFIYFQF